MSIRVVVVDDDDGFRRTAAVLLRRRGFVVVAQVSSMRDALRLLGTVDFDAALIDHHLPDGTGTELIRAVNDRCPTVRVLLTSADRLAAEDGALADRFVAKERLASVLLEDFLGAPGSAGDGSDG